jgi:hypothetical protein
VPAKEPKPVDLGSVKDVPVKRVDLEAKQWWGLARSLRLQGHCRSLYPFLDMAVAVSGVKAQANQFFGFPPYYRTNSNRTA